MAVGDQPSTTESLKPGSHKSTVRWSVFMRSKSAEIHGELVNAMLAWEVNQQTTEAPRDFAGRNHDRDIDGSRLLRSGESDLGLFSSPT